MNKYGAKKIIIDGIKFDSKKEGRRYQELKLLQKSSKIFDLELQKQFFIIEGGKSYSDNDKLKKSRRRFYKADFAYKEYINGQYRLVVEDVKGSKKGAAYQLYSLKRDLVISKYDVIFREL